jgi:hypothetical protein
MGRHFDPSVLVQQIEKNSNYSGSREEVQLLAGKSFGQPEKKLNFWLSSYKK